VSLNWVDNDPDFVIDYAPAAQKAAFIEDLYQLNGDNVPLATKVQAKFDAFTSHVKNANSSTNATQLFVSFASGFGAGINALMTPKVSLVVTVCLLSISL
jgi:1-phosphatidylinositol phosphodiesterase